MEKENIYEEFSLEYAKKIHDIYLKFNNNEDKIKELANNLELPIHIFLQYVKYYIEISPNIFDYVKIFNSMLAFDNIEDTIELLNNSNLSTYYLKSNLVAFTTRYKPNLLYKKQDTYSKLSQDLNYYIRYLKDSDLPTYQANEAIDYNSKHVITEFILSKLSVERFCFQKKITKERFESYLKRVKKFDEQLYQKCLCSKDFKKALKNQLIENDIYNFLSLIKNNESNFTSVDFYLNTTFSVKEVLKATDEKASNNSLSYDDSKLLRNKITCFKSMKIFDKKAIDEFLNSKFTFNIDDNLIDFKLEEKYLILTFLLENDIPISFETIREAFIKFNKNEINTEKHK